MTERTSPLDLDAPDLPFLWDMREAALGMIRLTRSCSFETFERDPSLIASTERGIGILGRAARLIDPELRAACPDVPWLQLIGSARMIADPEDALEPRDLWRIVEDLPAMVRAISALIPVEDEEERAGA